MRSLVLALLLLTSLGCGDDDATSEDAGADVDAGDTLDGGPVDGGAEPDAGPEPDGGAELDAGIDAGQPDMGSPAVTVLVTIDNAPAEGLDVQAHAADGSYLETRTTDATGTATFEGFPSGGAITAPVVAFGTGLTTYMGVQPGDALTFVGSVTDDAIGSIDIQHGGAAAGANRYHVRTQCGGASGSSRFTGSLTERCIGADRTLLGAAAWARVGTTTLGVTTAAVPITGTAPSLDASATLPAYGTPGIHTVTVTGLEAGARVLGREDYTIAGDYLVTPFNDETTTAGALVFDGASDDFDAAILFLRHFPAGAPGRQDAVFVDRSNTVASSTAPVDTALDVATELPLPPSDASATSGYPPVVTWTEGGGACRGDTDGADATIVALIEFGTATWTVVTPPGTGPSVTFPTLDPSTREALWPSAVAEPDDVAVIVVHDVGATWDELRTSDDPVAFAEPETNIDVEATRCLGRWLFDL